MIYIKYILEENILINLKGFNLQREKEKLTNENIIYSNTFYNQDLREKSNNQLPL